MSGNRPKKGPKKTGLTDDGGDDPLWAAYAKDIEPLKGKSIPRAEKVAKEVPLQPSGKDYVRPPASVRMESSTTQAPAQLDRRTETRLRRGQIPIEGRIDLHGQTQSQAENAVRAFIQGAHSRGARCLLVITGKGGTIKKDPFQDDILVETGVLKRNLKNWLSRPPLDSIVLKAVPAVPRDGGGGAFYVYLRRARGAEN